MGAQVRVTHSYAIVGVSKRTYTEVRKLLAAVDYGHAFHRDRDHGEVIDMDGLALAVQPELEAADQEKRKLLHRRIDHLIGQHVHALNSISMAALRDNILAAIQIYEAGQ